MKIKFVAKDLNEVPTHPIFWVEKNDGTRSPISVLAECIRRALEESRNRGMEISVDDLLYETGGDADPSRWERHQEMKRRVLIMNENPPEMVTVQVWGSTLTWTKCDNVVVIEGARCSISDWWGQIIDLTRYKKMEVTATSLPWLAPWQTMRSYVWSLIKAEALMRDRFDIVRGMESNHPELTMSANGPTNGMEDVYREIKGVFLPGHDPEKARRQAKEAVARYVSEIPKVEGEEFVLLYPNKETAAVGIDLGELG